MKQLDQSVFKRPDCPKWTMSAFIDELGYVVACNVPKRFLCCYNIKGVEYWNATYGAFYFLNGEAVKFEVIARKGYDTTNWQNSAIDREV